MLIDCKMLCARISEQKTPLLDPSMGKWPLGKEGRDGSLLVLRASPQRGTAHPAEYLLPWERVNGMFVSPGIGVNAWITQQQYQPTACPSRLETLLLVVPQWLWGWGIRSLLGHVVAEIWKCARWWWGVLSPNLPVISTLIFTAFVSLKSHFMLYYVLT